MTTEAVQPLGYIASQQAARAAAASPSWRKEGAVGAFAAASALAALAASASCEGPVKEPLAGLKSIRDAKEVVLYQYAVCPFCNKASSADLVALLLLGPLAFLGPPNDPNPLSSR